MADQPPTVVQIRQILSGIKKCSSLWAEVRVLTRSHQSMSTEIFDDVSDSFKATLDDGEHSIKEFMDVPKDQGAFRQGDNTSYAALQNVVEGQKLLVSNIEDIKRQLARAYQDQFNSKRSADPESILDIGNIMSMRDAAQEHIKSTHAALKALARRIDLSTDSPQKRSSTRPQGQYQVPQVFQPPPFPADQRGYRPVSIGQETPNMPERPPPQPRRPVQQSQPPQMAPTDPVSPQTPRPDQKRPPNPTPVAQVSTSPGSYCTGALRLQRDPSLTIRDIMRDFTLAPNMHQALSSSTPLICKHCNLELGNQEFRDAVFEGQKKGTMIAKQHMLACASIWDRKAMFKCLVCSTEDRDSEFRDIEDFKAHLKAH